MANASTNSAYGCDKVPTLPTCTFLSTAQSLMHATYFKEHASRHAVLPTLSEQTSKIADPRGLHQKPAPYFLPRPGRRPPEMPVFVPAQDGGRTQGQDGKQTKRQGHGQRARRRRETLNNHHTPGPPARRTTPRRTHGAGTEQRGRRTSQSHPARNRR